MRGGRGMARRAVWQRRGWQHFAACMGRMMVVAMPILLPPPPPTPSPTHNVSVTDVLAFPDAFTCKFTCNLLAAQPHLLQRAPHIKPKTQQHYPAAFCHRHPATCSITTLLHFATTTDPTNQWAVVRVGMPVKMTE
eukprot:353502-Chlamydomonas_euryale.AAC.7